MQPYLYRVFLLLLSNIVLIKGDVSSENEAEINAQGAAYSDVIKNITRVNNALSDLIKNYELLKNLYKSEETFEKDYSPDTEIDELYKKGNKKISRSVKKTTTKKPAVLATQMFMSDEESQTEGHEENKVITKRKKIKSKPKKIKETRSKPKKSKKGKIKSVNNKSKEIKRVPNVEYITEKSRELKLNGSGIQTDSYSDDNSYNEEDSNEVEHHLNLEQNPLDIKPEIQEKPVTYTIKRYDLTNSQPGGGINTIRDKTIKVSLVNDSKPVWKIIRSEDFSSKNIWDEIRKNKPINLKKESETMYNSYRASIEPNNSYPYTTESEIMANNRRVSKQLVELLPDYKANNQEGEKTKPKVHSKESVEFNRTVAKDQFETSILRMAYGDACLKVIVRKCFKACKQARKNACRHYHCKKKFKSVFKQHSKTGCSEEFKETTQSTPKNSAYNLNRATVNKADVNLQNGFHDVTRNGYLAGVCLPNKLRTAQKLPKNSKEKEINILRDRFERACQKESSNKCFDACKWAINNTCNTVVCNSKIRKEFRKACKKECKNSYRVGASDSSDSDSDSSDSNSDSSTDSSSRDDSKSKSGKKNGGKVKEKDNKEPSKKVKDKIKDEIKAKIMKIINKKKAEGKEVDLMDYFEKEEKEDEDEDEEETDDEKKSNEKD